MQQPHLNINTPRLLLRHWREEDIPALARMNADEQVMEYFLRTQTYAESLSLYHLMQEEFQNNGFGVYAVEERATQLFAGFVGFHPITFEVSFAPAIEILWRFLPEHWGKGYATEAASACLIHAKLDLKLDSIVAFTTLTNKRSERVMQKIGMRHEEEFDHPLVEVGHPLRRHVLYRV